MNRLSSRNRKLLYMVGVLVLLAPIGVLGMPATEQTEPGQKATSGGVISRLRHEYKLGDTTLGDVDPASATMNLVLLGMRGVAGAVLWMQADEQKETKNWSELEQTVESIIKLQPRFLQVWKFQGWNLAFNVSAECDAVEDRFFWVKKGAKFLLRGTEQNRDQAELYHDAGIFFGKKMGRSDEWKQFRRFFKSDPDPRWEGLADQELNPDGEDNYLVAKKHYLVANEKEELPGVEQHIMARILFRSYPWRSQMDYAGALERDGLFNELAREAWERAHYEWTTIYGQEEFSTELGGDIRLDADEEELQRLVDADPQYDLQTKKEWLDRYQNMTSYRYWKMRSEVESQREMTDARRALHDGKQLFFQGDMEQARSLMEDGLKKLEGMVDKYPELIYEDELIEDVLKSLLIWQYVLRLFSEPIPETYPLKRIWDENPDKRTELDEQFQTRVNTAF
jgi:hypothetical protein